MVNQTYIDDLWETICGNVSPIPDTLRDSLHDRWVRFHSLPYGQRYATNDAEHECVIKRHNTVLDNLAQSDELILFVSFGYSKTPTPVRDNEHLAQLDPNAIYWRTIMEDDDCYTHLHASEWQWHYGVFDAILRLVAAWDIADTMMIGATGHWIYHPYDGGADVIARTIDQRDALRSRYADWLSSHPAGL